MPQAEIGIIGGSGFYKFPGLEDIEEVAVDTPFGKPSDSFIVGTVAGRRVAFLARHGRGHLITPTELNARANIWAFKSMGINRVISVSAVGSMREEIEPTHLVVPDQIIDRTNARPRTFFGEGIVAHVAMADPYCNDMRAALIEAANEANAVAHRGGTYICVEGPQFSTRGESLLYRSWGVSVIGMTSMPEARLAREAEICYANLALATDYDSWHDAHEEVTVEIVVHNLSRSVASAQATIAAVLPKLADQHDSNCKCGTALNGAIMSQVDRISDENKARLEPILRRFLAANPAGSGGH